MTTLKMYFIINIMYVLLLLLLLLLPPPPPSSSFSYYYPHCEEKQYALSCLLNVAVKILELNT